MKKDLEEGKRFTDNRQTITKSIKDVKNKKNVVVGRYKDGSIKTVQFVSLKIQEVYCRNCFETIPMQIVDAHSL